MESEQNSWFLKGFLFPILYIFGRLVLYLGLIGGGINGPGDFPNYYEISSLKGYPYINYWVEYPPVFPIVNLLINRAVDGNFNLYSFLLYFLLSLSAAACIYFIFKISFVIFGESEAIPRSILFFSLIFPLPYTWWYFDVIPVLMMLVAILAVVKGSFKNAGGWIGLGILTKFFPLLLLPAVWGFRTRKEAFKITLIALGLTAFIFIGLWIASPELTVTSLASQPVRNSWQTIWAWIDGNLMGGSFASIESHYNPDFMSTDLIGNPPVISPWIRLLVFALIGLFLFLRIKSKTPLAFISFTGITWGFFLLWSSGWSPQWILYLIPLIMLTLPVQKAVFWSLLLILLTILEWPIILGHGLLSLLGPVALLRSAILIFLIFSWYRFTQKTPGLSVD